jgi:hypothetical protein
VHLLDSEFFQEGALAFTACRGDDLGSDPPTKVNGGQPYASGSGMNQDALPFTDLRDFVEAIVGGEISDALRSSLGER